MAYEYEVFARSVPSIRRGGLGPRNPDEIFVPLPCNTSDMLSQADILSPKLAGCMRHVCGSLESYMSLSCDFFVARTSYRRGHFSIRFKILSTK